MFTDTCYIHWYNLITLYSQVWKILIREKGMSFIIYYKIKKAAKKGIPATVAMATQKFWWLRSCDFILNEIYATMQIQMCKSPFSVHII